MQSDALQPTLEQFGVKASTSALIAPARRWPRWF
jgi:hypothetical protein